MSYAYIIHDNFFQVSSQKYYIINKGKINFISVDSCEKKNIDIKQDMKKRGMKLIYKL